jgi:O-antigen/teichoic acid export membrane protein
VFLATVAALPIASRTLSADEFGIWLIIVSAAGLLGFADLGIGNGLTSLVASAAGRDDTAHIRRFVASGFAGLLAVAAVVGAAFALIQPHVDWGTLLHLSSAEAADDAGTAVAVFAACFLVGIPFAIAPRVQAGLQEGWQANLWTAAGPVLGLVGVAIAGAAGGGLPLFVLAWQGGSTLCSMLHFATLFGVQRRDLAPVPRAVTATDAREVLRKGSLFLVLSLAIAVGYESDSLVIAHYLGSDRVADYQVPLTLFSVLPALVGFLVTPLWPAYSEALSRGDHDWVSRALARSLRLGAVVTVPLAAILVVTAKPIIQAWVGDASSPTWGLLALMGIWAALTGVITPIAIYLNGAQVIRFQVLCATSMAIANIVLSIVLVQSIGLSGPMLGTVIATTVFVVVPYVAFLRHSSALRMISNSSPSSAGNAATSQ